MKNAPSMKSVMGAVALMVTGIAAHAAPLTGLTLSGGGSSLSTAYTVTSPGILSPSAVTSATDLAAVLAGNAAAPGDNLELSKLGGAVATLTGSAGGHQYAFSSLTSADWFTSPGVATMLTSSYIYGAAAEAGIPSLTLGDYATAVAVFYASNAWQRVSDPNISYIDVTGNTLTLGLAGYISAKPVLSGLFPAYASAIPVTAQVSEVVKLSIDGGPAQYLFGFDATPSGLVSNDQTFSFTGNFQLTAAATNSVPEPSSIALVGAGLALAVAIRRRKKGAQAAA